jgi:hypothetical protein
MLATRHFRNIRVLKETAQAGPLAVFETSLDAAMASDRAHAAASGCDANFELVRSWLFLAVCVPAWEPKGTVFIE